MMNIRCRDTAQYCRQYKFNTALVSETILVPGLPVAFTLIEAAGVAIIKVVV